jgi:periplasmic protein TonB
MKQHRLLALALACLVLAPIALCQDDSTKAAPEPIYRVGGGVKAPSVTYSPDPEFPEKERKAGHQGPVLLGLVVHSDGLPGDIKVLRTLSPKLDKAAIDAVKKWRFSPATRDDKPVAVLINVEVNFHLY